MIKHVTIFLCMLFVFIGVSAQTKTLTGTVKDANQEPLIGVSIVEKGTSNGTITDLEATSLSKLTLNLRLYSLMWDMPRRRLLLARRIILML